MEWVLTFMAAASFALLVVVERVVEAQVEVLERVERVLLVLD